MKQLPLWDHISISQYIKIINHNWENIFEDYFIIAKEDKRKSPYELTSFLIELKEFRGKVMHPENYSSGIKNEAQMKSVYQQFDKVYCKWKEKSRKL